MGRKKEEGRRKKEEGRRKKKEERKPFKSFALKRTTSLRERERRKTNLITKLIAPQSNSAQQTADIRHYLNLTWQFKSNFFIITATDV